RRAGSQRSATRLHFVRFEHETFSRNRAFRILRANSLREEPSSVNRPAPLKPDNFFLMIYRALRQHRVPLVLRIASHTLLLVALALIIYAWVIGMQFKHAMEQQADALGQSLVTRPPPPAPDRRWPTATSTPTCCRGIR